LPADDEVARYAKDAQKRIKSLHVANTEWRRRVVQSQKDVATATTLAEQLYRENQQLKANVNKSETALISQALQRTEAQLQQARQRAKIAYANQNTDEIVAANEEVAKYVAEADRLRLLSPAAPAKDTDPPPPAAAQPQNLQPVQQPDAPTAAWLKKNPWFNRAGEEDLTGYSMGIHASLEKQGITSVTDPARYFGEIDKRLREKFPERFTNGTDPKPAGGRPVTVTGAQRTNGAPAERRGPRHVVLTESQVRIATSFGLTPEQYAAQLVKDEAAAKERIQ